MKTKKINKKTKKLSKKQIEEIKKFWDEFYAKNHELMTKLAYE